MVMTAPLDGVLGVATREVVVEDAAHANGPATNARALNRTGIMRLRDTGLEDLRRIRATIVECVMVVKAPIPGLVRKVSGRTVTGR
jgi:hypothetical protein